MNTKKFFTAVLVVFVLLEFLNYLIHGVILSDVYASEEIKAIFRPEEEMNSMMWIVWVMDLVWAFFFMFIFVKGYENKGIMEGLRYGVYMGLFFTMVMAYQSYAMFPLTYGLIFQWFIYGFVESIILGLIASLIYKPKEYEAKTGATAAA